MATFHRHKVYIYEKQESYAIYLDEKHGRPLRMVKTEREAKHIAVELVIDKNGLDRKDTTIREVESTDYDNW